MCLFISVNLFSFWYIHFLWFSNRSYNLLQIAIELCSWEHGLLKHTHLGESSWCCYCSCYHNKVKSTPRIGLGWEFDKNNDLFCSLIINILLVKYSGFYIFVGLGENDHLFLNIDHKTTVLWQFVVQAIGHCWLLSWL